MDLIERQAAIDVIDETNWYHQNENKDMVSGANSAEHQPWFKSDDVYSALKSVPTALRWIPVTERLPIEEFEDGRKNRTVYDLYPCLVTRYSTHTDEPRTRTYVCKSYFDGEDFMLHGGYEPGEGSDTENTLAWMPLPKPWKGE